MDNVPIVEVIKSLSIKDIESLALTNKDFLGKLLDPNVNLFYATHYGYPHKSTLKELKVYESMKLEHRLERAVKTSDARIVKKLFQMKTFGVLFITIDDVLKSNLEIIFEFIRHRYYDYNSVLASSAKMGKLDIFQYIIEKITELENLGEKPLKEPVKEYFTDYAQLAGSMRHLEIIKYLYTLGNVDVEIVLEKASGPEVTQWAIDHGAKNYNKKLVLAIRKQNLPVTKILLDAGANNFDEAIIEARGDMRIIKMITDRLK